MSGTSETRPRNRPPSDASARLDRLDRCPAKATNRRMLLDEWVSAGNVLATAAISIAEVYAGNRPGEEQKVERLFSMIECYPTTAAIARAGGELKRAAAERGKTIGLADALIAATALRHHLALVTDNRRDFSIPGLTLFPLP